MNINEIRLAVIAMVLEANKAQDEYVYSISINKYDEYVQATRILGEEYEIFCYYDSENKTHYHTKSTFDPSKRKYMTSQEVFEALKEHIKNAKEASR